MKFPSSLSERPSKIENDKVKIKRIELGMEVEMKDERKIKHWI